MQKLFILILMWSVTLTAFAQQTESNSISIEGKSSVKLKPELVYFNLNFSVTDSNYSKCSNMALLKIDQIKELFEKEGIDKDLISTQRYSTREIREHDYKTNKRVFKGYRTDIPVVIKTKSNYSKNHHIFEIINHHFNADFNMRFALSPEQMETAKEELIRLAIKDAKSKLKIIAENADVKIGNIKNITYGEPSTVGVYNNRHELMLSSRVQDESAKGFSALNPSDIEMRTNIFMVWGID